MLTAYRSHSAPSPIYDGPPVISNEKRDSLNVILLDIFTVDERLAMGPSDRIKMMHLMNVYIEILEARVCDPGSHLPPDDVHIVLKDNKWVLLDSLEAILEEAKKELRNERPHGENDKHLRLLPRR